MISVIIPTMKGREGMLYKLLTTIPDYCETVIVDDPDILLAEKRNKGALLATGDILFFIDDDNYLKEGAIDYALKAFKEDVGVVGLMACYHNDKDWIADGGSKRNMITGFTKGINTNNFWPDIDKEPYEVDEVANAFMIPKSFFIALGGLDQENFPIDLDEADFCKRTRDFGFKVMMCPKAVCYHDSQTYSHIPDFRRPINAYYMGRNRQLYQGIYLDALSYCVYFVFFLPVFVGFYTASLLGRKKFSLIPYFLRGVLDGLLGVKKAFKA